jgi:sarcosine oxidase/L-pipecolate oxidase
LSEEGTIVVQTLSGEEFYGAWTSNLLKSVTGLDLVQPLHTLICYWKVKPGHEHVLAMNAGFPTFGRYGDLCIYITLSMQYPSVIKIIMNTGRHAT